MKTYYSFPQLNIWLISKNINLGEGSIRNRKLITLSLFIINLFYIILKFPRLEEQERISSEISILNYWHEQFFIYNKLYFLLPRADLKASKQDSHITELQ